MMIIVRTIIELPDSQIAALGRFCKRAKVSRTEAVRQAVSEFLLRNANAGRDEAFGLWANKGEDGLQYQRRLREEWDR